MRNRLFIAVTFLGLSPVLASAQPAPTIIVLEQPSAPLTITEFKAEYGSGVGTVREGGTARIHYIQYETRVQNSSTETVVAYRLGFVAFNVFNEFMTHFRGTEVDEIGVLESVEASSRSAGPNSRYLLTAVVYVDRVRFRNGEVWVSDLELVGNSLRQIEQNFDVSILSEDDPL